jgi:hypothetical protein
MAGTKNGGQKFAAKKKAEDPDYFKKLSAKAKKPRGGKASPGSFKPGNKQSVKGGKAGKRGPAKDATVAPGSALDAFPLHYEDIPDKKK